MKRTIQERFEEFHAENPRFYDLLVHFARFARKKGKTIGEEPFKFSNDFTSRYARLMMEQEEDLQGFFELRELRSE